MISQEFNAKTFQEPLWKLAETIAQVMNREGWKYLPGPWFVSEDIHVMIRQSMANYSLLFYLNADERRENDCYWNPKYGVVAAPLVRSMIDTLYNITLILEDPAEHGPVYRKSGLKKRLLDIEEDRQTYAGKLEWESYCAVQLKTLDILIRGSGFTEVEIRSATIWKPLGTYILQGKPEDATPHQNFLKTFTHMQWRQYSALSHAAYDGYIGEIPAGAYFMEDRMPHEQRAELDKMYMAFLTRHIGRAAMILLCTVTELQLYIRIREHRINERIVEMWNALLGVFEVKEIYDERYCGLMREKGILPRDS